MFKLKRISKLLVITVMLSNFAMFGSINIAKADETNKTNNLTQTTNTTGSAVTFKTTEAAVGVKTLDVVEITDFHGQLLDTKNNQVGAALAKEVEGIKDKNPDNTLIIGGGDLYQGTPVSNVLKGVPVQKVLSKMGLEVTALGNHEFDWGLNTINDVTMKGANYEIVCSNLYNKDGNTRVYNPYKIINKNGVKIAVIGAILKDVADIVLPANIADYKVTDIATEINVCAQEIKRNNEADVILAVVHDGGSSLNSMVSNLHGVDAVFGGHTHTSYDGVVKDNDNKDVPVLNASSSGKGYIDLKISLDKNNKVTSFSSKGSNWHPLSVSATTSVDEECKKIVDAANVTLKPIFDEVIGNDSKSYSKDQIDSPYGESELGNWMADVVKEKASADVGIVNNGGIRLSPVPAGNITVGTIFYLMPFDNTVTTVNMTGAQLKATIEQGVAEGGKGLQVSGIKITYDNSKDSGSRVTSVVREKDGTSINPNDVIKVAAPDFLGTGGDGFTEFSLPEIAKTYNDSHTLVRDALIENVRKNKAIVIKMNQRLRNQSQSSSGTTTAKTMTIKEAKAAATTKNTSAVITGFVSGVNGKSVFLQDDPTNPTAGIVLYNTCGADVSKGDKIAITGKLSVYNGLIEIIPGTTTDVVKISANNTITPKEVTIKDINDDLQGELIKVKQATFTVIDTEGSTTIQDSTGNIVIFKMPTIFGLNVNDVKDVTANVSKYKTTLELILRDKNDVVDARSTTTDSKPSISIVATSDIHGSVLNFDYATNKAPSKGQGLAKVSTYVNSLRASNQNVMLVDNGDAIQGTPLVYYYNMVDKNSEYPLSKVMGAMKYDTQTIGNHEFNFGLDTLKRVIADDKKEGIHVLSANTYKSDDSNFVEPYYIKEFNINGKVVKVGILGLTTKCVPNWEDPKHYAGLHFNDLVNEAKKWVPIVKSNGADIVIVAAHSGEEGASDVIPENQIKAIANNVSGIDAIIAGHAHSVLNDLKLKNPEGKVVPVVEPGKLANYVSQIDITVDDNKAVTSVNTKNVQMDNTIAEDSNIVSLIESYQDKTLEYTGTVLGQATDVFSGKGQTTGPTAIMELINKVQAESAGAQLSIAAPLSASANIPKGNVTIRDLMGTYVYENYLYGVKMNGTQIKKWLEYSARYYKQVSKEGDAVEKDAALNVPDYNLDQLYGATYDIDLTKPVGSRIVNLKYQGKLIKDTDVFTVAINDYRYNGGGGFMKEAGISNTDSSIVTYSSAKALGDDGQIRSLMGAYIKASKTISPVSSNNWNISTKAVVAENTDSNNTNNSSSSSSKHKNNDSSSTDSTNNTNNANGTNNTLVKNNWVQADGKWYFVDEKGEKLVNTWKLVDNTWFFLEKDGSMKTGWLKDANGIWYYLQESGAMKTGWLLNLDNQWYYLNTDGSMKTGWLQDSDGKWYYLEADGSMAKNKVIDGWYLNDKGEWVA